MSMINLIPMNGHVLVKLIEEWEGVYTPDKKYDTKTSGLVVNVAKNATDELLNKKIYFEGFKDDAQVKDGDTTYAFIKIEDIRGYSE